jgi:hypothetical protein
LSEDAVWDWPSHEFPSTNAGGTAPNRLSQLSWPSERVVRRYAADPTTSLRAATLKCATGQAFSQVLPLLAVREPEATEKVVKQAFQPPNSENGGQWRAETGRSRQTGMSAPRALCPYFSRLLRLAVQTSWVAGASRVTIWRCGLACEGPPQNCATLPRPHVESLLKNWHAQQWDRLPACQIRANTEAQNARELTGLEAYPMTFLAASLVVRGTLHLRSPRRVTPWRSVLGRTERIADHPMEGT